MTRLCGGWIFFLRSDNHQAPDACYSVCPVGRQAGDGLPFFLLHSKKNLLNNLQTHFINLATIKNTFMKYFLILLFLGGSLTIFAQTNIDGNWKGTRETPNGTFEV